jgi:ABC-2 type transport system ATP-binding protein
MSKANEANDLTAGPAISVEDVSCRFGKRTALDHLTLRVQRGTIVGVVGPNGAGKTTLIETVCGLTAPSAGRVTVLGYDAARRSREVRARIGVVPQETALYEDVTARQNLRFAAALYGVRDSGRRVDEVLAIVGLSARANDVVRLFSGGMQRRLAVARALLHNPALLILDEPTVGVDVEARHLLWTHIRALRAEGRTVLLTTNYLDEAEALCDRVAILRAGRLVAEDTPAALIGRAGRCLEIACAAGERPVLLNVLTAHAAVLRVETTPEGVTAYLDGQASAEEVMRGVLAAAHVESFRSRSPDLVEVFRALSLERAA